MRSADDIPIEDDVAGAGQRQRLALDIGDRAVREAAAGEGILHDGEADQHDDQHEAADAATGETRSLVSEPVTVKPAAQTHSSSRNHVGISITARSYAVRSRGRGPDEADRRDGRQRNARDAGRHRRIIDGKPDEGDEEQAARWRRHARRARASG